MIDADFDVTDVRPDGRFELIVESAGQATSDGRRRNPEYLRLLEELLMRVASIGADLEDALVASRRIEHLPEQQRRIHSLDFSYPVQLSGDMDFAAMALSLTRPQADIGSSRTVKGGGNRRKRLFMAFRAHTPISRAELTRALRASEVGTSDPRPGVATGVARADVDTAIGWWRNDPDDFLARFGPPVPRRYVVVEADDEIVAEALVIGARAAAGADLEGPWRVGRSDVVLPLRTMGFAVEDLTRPHEAPLGGDPRTYQGLAGLMGGTDVAVRRMGRREQRFLRGSLGIGLANPEAPSQCGMCGRLLPQSLLVAAHIKPRHLCSESERLDMPHVGWALCLLGCDALFERGFVSIDKHGRVQILRDPTVWSEALASALDPIVGRTAPGWCLKRRTYFAAHVAHHSGS